MAAVGRFVVILAAVVADYTRLVEADEEPAREQLDALCRQAVFPKVAQHNGRIARTSGESLLVEFADPTEAVRCAVDVQRGMIDRDHAAAPERRIAFRVGISMGEMRASGDDLVSRAVAALPIDELATLIRPGARIYGSAVNMALLVAALAEPGGICISGPVREAVHDDLPYAFEDVGTRDLDTHAVPMRCYQMSANAVRTTPHLRARDQFHGSRRGFGLRSAAIAAGVVATVGVWGVALWAWLGVNWSPTPAALPVIVGSRLSSTSGNVDKGTRTAVTEAPPAAKTADPTTQAPSSQAPLANNHATNRASQAASMTEAKPVSEPPLDGSPRTMVARPSVADIGAVVIRGKQGPWAPAPGTEGGTVAVRDVQGPQPLQAPSNSVTAVFNGIQGETASQTTPEIGTAVARGNQSPMTLQKVLANTPEVLKGTRAASKAETTIRAKRAVQAASEP